MTHISGLLKLFCRSVLFCLFSSFWVVFLGCSFFPFLSPLFLPFSLFLSLLSLSLSHWDHRNVQWCPTKIAVFSSGMSNLLWAWSLFFFLPLRVNALFNISHISVSTQFFLFFEHVEYSYRNYFSIFSFSYHLSFITCIFLPLCIFIGF